MGCGHEVLCYNQSLHLWDCVDCGAQVFKGPTRSDLFALRARRTGSLSLEVGSFSVAFGLRSRFGRSPFDLTVGWKQKRRWPRVKGRDMLSPERAAECRRLIHGEPK